MLFSTIPVNLGDLCSVFAFVHNQNFCQHDDVSRRAWRRRSNRPPPCAPTGAPTASSPARWKAPDWARQASKHTAARSISALKAAVTWMLGSTEAHVMWLRALLELGCWWMSQIASNIDEIFRKKRSDLLKHICTKIVILQLNACLVMSLKLQLSQNLQSRLECVRICTFNIWLSLSAKIRNRW